MKSPISLAFVILLSAGSCLQSQGQNKSIDSLKNVLQKQRPDTNKALTYVRLSEQFVNIGDTANIFLYTDSAISLSRKLSFKRIEASATENQGYGYIARGKFDSAKKDFLISLDIRRQIGNKRGIAQSYYSLGQYYYRFDSLPEALENYYHALEGFDETRDLRASAGIRIIVSRIYLNQGNDSEALINAQLALKIQREMGDESSAANTKEIMGNIEYNWHHYELALKQYLEAIQMLNAAGMSQSNSGEIYLRIGDVYQKQGEIAFLKGNQATGILEYSRAMTMYDSTGKRFIELNNRDGIIYLGIHYAKIYIQYGQFSRARGYLQEFINIRRFIMMKPILEMFMLAFQP